MENKKNYIITLIYEKLKQNNIRKINLEKEEVSQFINFLIKNK